MCPCISCRFIRRRRGLRLAPRSPHSIVTPKFDGRTHPTAAHEASRLFACGIAPRVARNRKGRVAMSIGTILLIILVLLLVGALPAWPYSTGWGYYPSGGLGLVLIILLVLVVTGRL